VRQRGYTLLELIVVVAILAALSGMALLTLRGASPAERLARDADRVAELARAACDDAILRGRSVALAVDGVGYRGETAEGGEWRPHPDALFRPRQWSVPVTARLEVDAAARGEAGRIRCLPGGELVPFRLRLTTPDGAGARVTGDADGRVERPPS
jgi:type II secretion system protein H